MVDLTMVVIRGVVCSIFKRKKRKIECARRKPIQRGMSNKTNVYNGKELGSSSGKFRIRANALRHDNGTPEKTSQYCELIQ